MNKTLQAIGLVSLFAWTALGVFAWTKVEGQVSITVAEAGGDGPDGLALLNDRLDLLSGDLDAVVVALQQNFQILADAVQEDALVAEGERARTAERLRQLEAALPAALEAREAAGALDEVLARLELLASSLTAAPLVQGEAPPVGATPGAVDDPAGAVADVLEAQPEETAVPEPEAVAAPVEPEAPARRSFLAFQLPSRDFRFEGAQTFEVLADLSRVGFDAKSTLHDFTGVSNRVRGEFRVDLANAAAGIEGRVEIDSASLDTGLEGRDEAMWEHLDTERHASISFVPSAFTTEVVDPAEQRLSGALKGAMTIHGVTREVTLDVKAHVDESRRLVVEGELPLRLTDFEVPVPNKLGMISVEDEVRVWISLRLRARPEAAAR